MSLKTASFLHKSIGFVIQFRWLLIVLGVLIVGISGLQTLKKLSIDNSLGIWFLEEDPSYKAYIEYQETYGSDEIFIVMLPVSNALEQKNVDLLRALNNSLDSMPFVQTAYSLAKAKYPVIAGKKVSFRPLYEEKRSEKSIKKLWGDMPEVMSQLVSKDFKNLFLYVQLRPTPSIEKDRKDIAQEIETVISRYFESYHITGPPVLNEAYNKGIYKESLLFGGLTVLVITLMLLWFLPSKKYLLIALFSVGTPISILFGMISGFGYSLNMISMLIPTILMVYSVSDVVHLINIYDREAYGLATIDRLSAAIKKSFTPCFYTTLTTFVGYFALYLSPLPAFKNMGLFTCIGLVLSYVLVYLITIIGVSFMKAAKPVEKAIREEEVPKPKTPKQTALVSWINATTSRYNLNIITGFSALLMLGIFAITKVEINTDSLNLLAEGPAKEDLRKVEAQLEGSSRLQLEISSASGSTVMDKKSLELLRSFQEEIATNPLITAPISVVNMAAFLEKRNPALNGMAVSEQDAAQLLRSLENNDNQFFKLFSEDLSSVGITLSLPQMKTAQLEQVIESVKKTFQSHFDPTEYTLKVNGFAVVFAGLNKFILATQLKSFFAAFIAAFICLWLFIRQIRTTLLVLIPNILPLAVLAILMWLFKIPLDVTTAMITPIMLGIAMDDTIHLIYKYRKYKTTFESPTKRIDQALHYSATALLATTVALVAGFLIIATSAVPSVRSFGILCAVTVSTALITDLFYLPALLKRFEKN
ncbi:MAG: MMPL family transporter [Flavobacteriaceae bacterium]|nr:MMPL family transporter [Flavobacteriaceae bacterium]|tara:strand:+ start:1215 stop:3491 length:2277 start_codon:yes stop_codon:yes gene_type:complete